jgi:uncharacterized protein
MLGCCDCHAFIGSRHRHHDAYFQEEAMSTRAWAGGGVVAAAVAVVLAAVLVTAASGQDPSSAGGPPHTITVSSTATISTKPDEAVITLSVHIESPDSAVALNVNSRTMNDVIAAMKSLGITQRDMETTNLNVTPQTINRGTPEESTSYHASTSLEVKVHDFDVIGPAIQKGVQAGATSVRGVKFQVSDPVGAKKHALEAAVESARAKADALAGAAGARVTGVVQIREGGSPAAPQPYFVRNQSLAYHGAASDLTVVPPRDITTRVSITVIWSIG